MNFYAVADELIPPEAERNIINEQQSGELQVIDVNGRVLQRYVIENGGAIQLPAIRLPAGLYLLRLASKDLKVRTGRLVVY